MSSRDEFFVEPVLDWQPLQFDDLTEVSELRMAIEYFDDPTARRSLADMEDDFALPHAHASRHGVVGRDRGRTIVAYSWNHPSPPEQPNPHVWLEIGVHPAWRHQRIGQRLVAWSIARAREWYRELNVTGPLWVGCPVDEGSRLAADLVADAQLHPQRWFFDVHRQLEDAPLPPLQVPSGFTLRPFDSAMSEQVRQAHNAAFSTRDGSHDVSVEDWAASLHRPEFRCDWSWVLLDGDDQVAGYVLNCELADVGTGGREGWSERLGVRPQYRDRGLGAALLVASMQSFRQAGCDQAGIGVDTDAPQPALKLFGGLGYWSDSRVILYGARFWD